MVVVIKKHENEYENISAQQFELIGMEMLSLSVDGSQKMLSRRFIANFGCLPLTCASLWSRCLASGHEYFMAEVECLTSLRLQKSKKKLNQHYPPYKPKHLLWALNFLKNYTKEEEKIVLGRESEKTMREWIWRFVEVIAALKNEVVS